MPMTHADRNALLLAAAIIEQTPFRHYTIPQLAEKVNMPEKKLKACFKNMFGMGLYAYLRKQRLKVAEALMLEGRCINVAMKAVGYKSESNFCSAFNDVYGDTPGAYIKKRLKGTG
jgi:AraC-like DNA-binding protein